MKRQGPLQAKLNKVKAQLPYLPRALGLVWAAAPGLTAAWLALLVVQGLLPAATVLLMRSLVDGLVALVGGGAAGGAAPGELLAAAQPVVLLAAALAGVMLLSELLGSGANWLRTAQAAQVGDHIQALIHAQSAAVDLAFYESPAYHDRLHRARSEASYRPLALVENLGGLAQNGITLAAMAAVLLPYGAWLPAALVVSTLPALWVVLHHQRRHHTWWQRTTADERRSWYYGWLLTARETAAELRLFGLGDRFRAAYLALRRRLRAERLRLVRNEALARLAANGAALLVAGGAMAWMIWRALQGLATLGDLTLFYQAFQRGQGLMRSLLENLGQIYGNSLFLGDLFEFLGLQPQVVEPAQPSRPPERPDGGSPGLAVAFEGVAFRYPGSRREAVHELHLTLPAGQIAAIVGPNGAGKSTLVKLLCRFYDPEAGRVLLDGVDVRDLSLADLRGQITVLFQDPVYYQATVAGNIDLEERGSSRAEVEAAVRAAGAEEIVARLPQGYDTLLGRWFEGGTDLSAGEWQRLALARALLRRAPVIVLDEPTSAMDPWAEAEWLRRFPGLVAGRTAVVITHRLTTAAVADRIYVMEGGRLVEAGGHVELLALGGRYAELWGERAALGSG
jgi:ATP-binding cassette, subfamily B, bacterial